mgnify:CR=1 FL=1|jgi:hypothetical protein
MSFLDGMPVLYVLFCLLAVLPAPADSKMGSPKVPCLSPPNSILPAGESIVIARLLSRHPYARKMAPAKEAKGLVFFAVNSARGNSILRDVIRRTWGSVAQRLGIQVKFFVGHSDEMLSIEIEKAKNNDVVVLDVDEGSFKGGYNLLARKTMLLMKWADRNLNKKTSFVVKVDDDVYFDVEAFVARVWGIKRAMKTPDEKIYYGYINEHSEPIRDPSSKWYDPDFKASVYPPYAAGIFYMLSIDAVSFLARNSQHLKQWRNEDASMGTWLFATNTRRVHDLCVYPSRSYRSANNPVLALHMAMSTNVKTSVRKLKEGSRDFDMLFTASLMNAAHRHIEEFGTILGVCRDSVGVVDESAEAENIVYLSIDEWVLGRM